MNLISTLLGLVILALLIAIGYKVGQIVVEINSPIVPVTTSTGVSSIEESSSSLLRWNHFPITVYIDDSFVKNNEHNYVSNVVDAMNRWESTSIVSFSLVDNPSNADISIEWVPVLKDGSSDTLGNTDVKFSNISKFNVIQKADIQLLTKSDFLQLGGTDMTNLALHEIGHAIGLKHTNEENDIMNPVLDIPSKSIKEISTADITTLMSLYEAPNKPDLKISGVNVTKSSFTRLGRYYFYLNVSISIQNIGITDSPSFRVNVLADNLNVSTQSIDDLQVGSTLNLIQSNLRVETNFTKVTVHIDKENLIEELDETNNIVEAKIS